jgi:putative CocE/NonD family hydrolase
MPAMAKALMPRYKSDDKATYFDNLFRIQMAAQEYNAAIATLDSILELNKDSKYDGAPAIGIQFRIYALTKIAQSNSSQPFEQLFTTTIEKVYSSFPEKAKSFMASYFGADPAALKKQLDPLVENARRKDSIPIGEARALVRIYNSWNVYNQIVKPGTRFLAMEEKRTYDIRDSILIPVKDGGQLSAIIVRRRDATGPQPVVLVYNIYAGAVDKSIAFEAVAKGYTGIVLSTRGKKLSPGPIEPFEHDASDAYDAIDWISKQPWCNGKIGMYGGSYLGFSQWSAVKKVHPALKTIVPQVAVGIGIDYPMYNNIFMSYMLQWIHYVTNNKLVDQAEFSNQQKWDSVYTTWYRSGRSYRSLDSIDGRPDKIFQRWLDHPSYDSYWQSMVPYQKEFANINIPVLTTTGYYDDDQRGAFYYFNQHLQWNKAANHYLLIGPYDHGGAQSAAVSVLRGYTIDSVANISVNNIVFQWFDHILKDGPMPPMLKDKINYQVMGTNSWRHAPSINNISKDTLTFYLTNTLAKNSYKLVTKQPATVGHIAQEIDYHDRTEPDQNAEPGFDPLLVLDALKPGNKLLFTSEPLTKDIIMTGSFGGAIAATINKKDIDLAIDLYELQPNGKYLLLSSYRGRASYAKDHSRRQLLQPGVEARIPIVNSTFISKKLTKGSRVIVLLGMNNNSKWQVNYGTGKDVSSETIKDGSIPLQVKWGNKSCIKLPIEK